MSLGVFDGLGKAPTRWWPDDRVKQLQGVLNPELKRLGCSTQLKTDGLIGPGTCGALSFVDQAAVVTGVRPSAALVSLVKANASDFAGGCSSVKPWTAPKCPAPSKAAPPPASVQVATTAPSGAITPGKYDERIQIIQFLANGEMEKRGRAKLPENGILDTRTCTGIKYLIAESKKGTVVQGVVDALREHGNAIGAACGTIGATQAVAPKQIAAPAHKTLKPKRPANAPPLDASGRCRISYGRKYPEVAHIQRQLNVTLRKNSYEPIPVTSVWDARTCGAIFELRGKFDPVSTADCPRAYAIALSCPQVIPPKKRVAPKPPPVKKAGVAAWALPAALATIVAGGGYLYAKKKGLVG